MSANPNLIGKLRRRLPDAARELLDNAVLLAERRKIPVYLVGGPLRDLLLERPSLDLDIAVEGDAIALAQDLAKMRRDAPKARLPGKGKAKTLRSARPEALVGRAGHLRSDTRLTTHPRFGTSTIRIPPYHLDLITTRSETYARPGALPTVTPATIHEDLRRRDFTNNALALGLNGPNANQLLDPTSGQLDLNARLIRVLHEHSFQDDATRILRAARYASRLGFEIEPQTRAWLKRDLRYLETISGTRLRNEITRIFAEDRPEQILLRLHRAGALTAIHPALRFTREHCEAFVRLRDFTPTGARAAYWPVLAWHLSEGEAISLAHRLALTRTQRDAVEAMPRLQAIISRRDAPQARLRTPSHLPGRRSALAQLLAPFPVPALWAHASLTTDTGLRDRVLDYLTRARKERTLITGNDLRAFGVASGPQLGDVLRQLKAAKLDGEVTSHDDEEAFVRRLLAGEVASSRSS
jgi:tRNA nucleotidyltransferase (CCA-adding enzyme)